MKNTCSKTSLHDFIRCLFHQDYSVLSEGKECKPDELMNAWQQIYEEYCLISGSPEYAKILKCLNEINRLLSILLFGGRAIQILSCKYSPENIAILKRIGFNYDFSNVDRKSYDRDIENCSKKMKGFEVQLQIQQKKKLELFGLDENGEIKNKKQQQTEKDFLKSVAVVRKSIGTPISLRETMLDEWAGMVALHNEMNTK
jgi:hypothetical protein